MLEKIKQYRLGVAILALVLIALGLIINKLIAPTLAANLVQGSGRMDGDLINLNAKYAGRITTLNIQEGQKIALNQTVAVLSSEEYEAQKTQIEAQIGARVQELNAKVTELEIASKTIPETLSKAKDNLSIKQHQRAELDKNIASQTSILAQDKHDFERMKNLFEQNLIEKRQVETAALKFQTSGDLLAGLHQKREQLSLAINVANSELIEATAHQKTLQAMQQGIEALKSSLKALEASKT
jgi:HlyD family secretion protein